MAEEIGESTAPTLAEQYADVVQYLQNLETVERTRSLPHLAERAPNLDISDLRAAAKQVELENDDKRAGTNRGLKVIIFFRTTFCVRIKL